MYRVLVSGCLGGRPLRYDGSGVQVDSDVWDRWSAEGRLVPFCPEVAVGFPVPRPPAEIVGGTAEDVMRARARVIEDTGTDQTERFQEAARAAVRRAKEAGVSIAVLVDGSPSCGSTHVYDGSFRGRLVPGEGVVTQALRGAGIRVFGEHELTAAAAHLALLDAG